ncbi:MAG: hypothetical protein IJX53_01795 [Clostridia bacterium]|nr:hypothetical protein [Clostridia bacterium]
MMLLYFPAPDLPTAEAAAFCARQRRRGRMICLPHPDAPPEKLAALPFTAAILHYRHDPTGLPDADALHSAYPRLPLIALGDPPQADGVWRVVPGTDHELNGKAAAAEYEPLLAFLRDKRGLRPVRRTSLYLPEDRRRAMVMTRRISFSADEFTLLRVLAASYWPLPSTLLCGFNVNPGDRHSTETVTFHVHNIKEKTETFGVPPLIHYIFPDGYTLAPPYNQVLPDGAPDNSPLGG